MSSNSSNSSKSSSKSSSNQKAVNQMKYEIANELGVNLGPDATSRQNGSVGGEITKRLVNMAENSMNHQNQNNQNN